MVNFVGAGSGAPDLITLRGFELIKKADVIIYAGSLVNPELLKNARVDCEIYNSALMTLDEVIEVMASSEKAGKMTVRLHTGDPSVFGAVREQFDRLERLGIPYTVTPGVSSFCAAAAALKAEYTLPGITQSVIITRREGKTAVPEKERIRELAKHTATMVIFLSASMTLQLSQELVEGGYSPETPCAIVYKASWEDEKICRCDLKTLAQTAEKNGITKTALICVGDFLGDNYSLSKLYDKSFETEFRKAAP